MEVGAEEIPATFDRDIYDQDPEIRFMTYGEPVFERLVGAERSGEVPGALESRFGEE